MMSNKSEMENFKIDIKSLSGIWATNDVYFTQTRSGYYADYKPAYPNKSDDDAAIYRSGIHEDKHTLIARLSDGWITRDFGSFKELAEEIHKAREAVAKKSREKGPMEEIAEVSPGIVELCTFPDDDRDYCKTFHVPKDWLLDVLERLDSLNENKGVDLENFLNNYVWDETYFIYEQAVKDGKLINKEESK